MEYGSSRATWNRSGELPERMAKQASPDASTPGRRYKRASMFVIKVSSEP